MTERLLPSVFYDAIYYDLKRRVYSATKWRARVEVLEAMSVVIPLRSVDRATNAAAKEAAHDAASPMATRNNVPLGDLGGDPGGDMGCDDGGT